MIRRLALALGLIVAMTASAAAETPRVIIWEELIPTSEPIENPFLKLDESVRDDVGFVLRVMDDLRLEFITKDSDEYLRAIEVDEDLKSKGIDVSALLAKIDELDAEIARRGAEVVDDLDGQVIRMPGYALPLELSEDGVMEFLLVPYVGACIHSPPPPPNQMVFVTLREEYKMQSLYDPVWITGRLRTEPSSRSLSFVDGQSQVSTGYALDAITIEPY